MCIFFGMLYDEIIVLLQRLSQLPVGNAFDRKIDNCFIDADFNNLFLF